MAEISPQAYVSVKNKGKSIEGAGGVASTLEGMQIGDKYSGERLRVLGWHLFLSSYFNLSSSPPLIWLNLNPGGLRRNKIRKNRPQ